MQASFGVSLYVCLDFPFWLNLRFGQGCEIKQMVTLNFLKEPILQSGDPQTFSKGAVSPQVFQQCTTHLSTLVVFFLASQVVHPTLAWWWILHSTIRSRVDTGWPSLTMPPVKCEPLPILWACVHAWWVCGGGGALIIFSVPTLTPVLLQVRDHGEVLEQWAGEETLLLPPEWNCGESAAWTI